MACPKKICVYPGECPVYLDTHCVYYSGSPMTSIPVNQYDDLEKILKLIDEKLKVLEQCCGGIITTSSTTTTTTTVITTTTTTTTTIQTFDTQLTFESDTYSFQEGIAGQSLETSSVLKLEFNKVLDPLGLYNTMTISVLASPVLQVTYRQEYLNHSFKFTDTSGNVFYGVFNNDVNFS